MIWISFRRQCRRRSTVGGGVVPLLALCVLVLLFAGCAAVGPEYIAPNSAVPPAWHTETGSGTSGAAADPRELSAWWTNLGDPVLVDLEARAVAGNLDLKQAVARMHEARARLGVSRAAQFPAGDAAGSVSRSKGRGEASSRGFYAAGFDAGWELDIFGGVRRAVEAAAADLAAGEENVRDVLVSLTAEVALDYLELRTLQRRLAVATENIAAREQTFELVRLRRDTGLADELELQQARAALENARALIPSLRADREAAKNRLAVLTGVVPGTLGELLAEPRSVPLASPLVAVEVPAETLRRRPDIRRAERELAGATARIGVATADLYPRFRLAGSIGLESLQSGDLFDRVSRTWNIGPSVSWKVFDAGAIRRNIEVQTAIQERYLLAWEAAVLGAYEEVESALSAYAEEQVRHDRLFDAAAAAREAEGLARERYAAGLADFLTVLDAQRTRLSYEDQLAAGDGAVTAELVRLYKALGGGW
ncbi:MAG: efflux transporter outer membrane subunit [Deltaproteobacteria bacterium]|nr:efflux transporter outer membrane subunit [Candidatus Anaeroferrophillacea bacterium]